MTRVTHQRVMQPETHTCCVALSYLHSRENTQSSGGPLDVLHFIKRSSKLHLSPGPDKRAAERRGIRLRVYLA